ncbi:MAG: hypothetical protein ACO31H_07010 [Bacteroidia bacterium]
MKTTKSTVWQRFTVWFLSVAFMAPSLSGLFHQNSHDPHSSHQLSTNWSMAFDQAHHHSFPMDEQQNGLGELEVVFESGAEEFEENTSEATYPWYGLVVKFGQSFTALGLWTRIGEKNQGVPPALYLRHHALRIPS